MNVVKIPTVPGVPSRDTDSWELDVICWRIVCMAKNPKNILELGTGRGLFLSSVMPFVIDSNAVTINAPLGIKTEGKYTTFDIPGQEIGEFFRDTDLESRIEQVFCLTKDMLDHLGKRQFDLVHIDASHDRDDIIRDTENCLKILSPTGTIVWHDFHPDNPQPWNRDVYEAIEHLQKLKKIGEIHWFERSWVAFWTRTKEF